MMEGNREWHADVTDTLYNRNLSPTDISWGGNHSYVGLSFGLRRRSAAHLLLVWISHLLLLLLPLISHGNTGTAHNRAKVGRRRNKKNHSIGRHCFEKLGTNLKL